MSPCEGSWRAQPWWLAPCSLPATAAEARPFTDLTSLTPTNKESQRLQQVRRGRDLLLVVGFRMIDAPLAAGYRVRVSATLRRGDDKLVIKSKMAPVVYTGAYRFSLPLRVPAPLRRRQLPACSASSRCWTARPWSRRTRGCATSRSCSPGGPGRGPSVSGSG